MPKKEKNSFYVKSSSWIRPSRSKNSRLMFM